MGTFSSVRVIVPSTANFDVQIEEYKASIHGGSSFTRYITYRLNRKHMKVESFVSILNGCEMLADRSNKYFLKLQHYFFSKDSDYIYLFFEHSGAENL